MEATVYTGNRRAPPLLARSGEIDRGIGIARDGRPITGAPGTVAGTGVTGSEAGEGALLPTTLVATTLKV